MIMERTIAAEHVDLLREVLDSALRELRFEIGNTDSYDYRQELRAREAALRELLEPLGGPLPDTPPHAAAR